MEKTLKFADNLVPLVLSGEKTSTWRISDDKDLQVGDKLVLLNKATLQEFAKARIVLVRGKTLGEIEDADFDSHERYESKEKLFAAYRSYYGDRVTEDTKIKIIDFELLK
ncbi:MAG: ASCH domain-containing protein [Candidatus Moraniibacteriota bacterium]